MHKLDTEAKIEYSSAFYKTTQLVVGASQTGAA